VKKELDIDLRKIFFILLPIVLVFLLYMGYYVNTHKPIKPQIIVINTKPCLYENKTWVFVDEFKINDIKYICADIETDRSRISLTLIVELSDNYWKSYAYESNSTSGFISVLIRDHLPPGTYRARILYARDTLDYTEFSVIEK